MSDSTLLEVNDLEEVTDFIPSEEYLSNKYLSYRFKNLTINEVTVENYEEKLVQSLAEQVSMFIPPSGSFETPDLQRYLELVQSYETSSNDLVLGLSLADQIRITFSDMQPATICEKFPDIDLATKRRYRCVAEYLIRQEELEKVKDERGKLVKKVGNMGKLVVIYQPLEKVRKTLQRSGLTQFIKNDRSTKNAHLQTAVDNANADGTTDGSAGDGTDLH